MLGSHRFASWLTAIVLSTSATWASAATIEKLTPPDGFGRVQFNHMKMNAAGDFVAVTHTKVFVGQGAKAPVTEVLSQENASFVISAWTTINSGTQQIRAEAEIYDTRLDLNERGDFVVASNSIVWVGNTRTGAIHQVYDIEGFAEIQQVLINEAGQYVAISDEKILGGNVESLQATELLAEAVGTFSVYDLYAYTTTGVSFTSGARRLALNEKGQFVAITASAVYHGDLNAMTAAKLYEERWVGFRHVSLNEDGAFVAVADKDVFSGSL